MATQSHSTHAARGPGTVRSKGRTALRQSGEGAAPEERVRLLLFTETIFRSNGYIHFLLVRVPQSHTYAQIYLSCTLKLRHFFLYQSDLNKARKRHKENWTLVVGAYKSQHLRI